MAKIETVNVKTNLTEIEEKCLCVVDQLKKMEFNVTGHQIIIAEGLLRIKYIKDGGSTRIKTLTFAQVDQMITLV